MLRRGFHARCAGLAYGQTQPHPGTGVLFDASLKQQHGHQEHCRDNHVHKALKPAKDVGHSNILSDEYAESLADSQKTQYCQKKAIVTEPYANHAQAKPNRHQANTEGYYSERIRLQKMVWIHFLLVSTRLASA